MIESALYFDGKKYADLSKRAGIHAYFFVHGTKFLKEGGQFGFVVSNSWLDTDYGRGLQEFFLAHYKIVAIIESKVERWFEAADVNTCIVILEKCEDERARMEHPARFVYLKKPLRHFLPPTSDVWEKQLERQNAIEDLRRMILAHNEIYENDDLRIYPRRQKDLWTEGFDAEANRYVGAKWGKYLRAPEIFFRVLEKGKDIFVPLKSVAEIQRGFTTGANEFFYLTEEEIKRKKIEKPFWTHKSAEGRTIPNYIVKSPRECKTIKIQPDDLKFRVLMIHKDKKSLKGKSILKYIEAGEEKGLNNRPTCQHRDNWYDLGRRRFGDAAWIYIINDRYVTFENSEPKVYLDCELFDIYFRDKQIALGLLAYLNSSIIVLFSEIGGRTVLGQGALKTQVYEVEKFPVPKASSFDKQILKRIKSAFNNLSQRPISSILDEIGVSNANEVSLEKVKPDRRELDKIIMGDILGLSEAEQLEVYRAVVDLVKSRLDKARSVTKQSKKKSNVVADALSNSVVDEIRNGD